MIHSTMGKKVHWVINHATSNIHTYMSYAQLSLLERRIASCCLPVFDAGVLINLEIYQ